MRRLIPVMLLAAMLCMLSAVPALAQSFPAKPVRIVVPYPAGGSTDVIARALARELSTLWAQPVVVENISGAGSIIGAEKVATASPDGHTLLLTIDPTVVHNRFLYKKLPYDPDKSLIPVTMIARSGQFVIVHPSVTANNLRELVELARRTPGKIAYASYGIGTQTHLLFETLGKREGVQFLHVPYKGVAPATAAAVSGEVQASVGSPAATGAMKGRQGQGAGDRRPAPREPLSRCPDHSRVGLPLRGSDNLVRAVCPWRHRSTVGGTHLSRRNRHRKAARVHRQVHRRVQPRSGGEYPGRIRRRDPRRCRGYRRDGKGRRRAPGVDRQALLPRRGWRCALRAPTAFSARIEDNRTESAVSVDCKDSSSVLYEIAARTGRRPRHSPCIRSDHCSRRSCALRAPTALSARIKGIRAETAVMINNKRGFGFHTRSPIAPGRHAVRAISQLWRVRFKPPRTNAASCP